MRITLFTIGTLGDTQPFVALALDPYIRISEQQEIH